MPRKVNYALDYDEDYDTYDDYDDYDYEHEAGEDHDNDQHMEANESEKLSQTKKAATRLGTWHCLICTYINEDTSISCEICGVFRDSAVKHSEEKVNGAKEDAGASAMSKSLPKFSVNASKIGISFDDCSMKKMSNLHGKGTTPPCMVSGDPQSASIKAASSIKGKEVITMPSVDNEPLMKSLGNRSNSRENDGGSHVLTNSLHQLKLEKKTIVDKKPESHYEYKPEKWILSDQEGHLNQLNLAIVGHVDSGKSTLSGRLLHLVGQISKKAMHKYEKEAKEKGKGSFAFAWAMDESSEERERGVTMTVAVAYFDSKNYRVVLLDSPGHKDFVPNMISGATQADAAILVVDASKGSFEAGMSGKGVGQTREHAQLVRSFGVEQIIIAVNKMDVVGYSKERYDFIQSELGSFLRSCGFKDSSVKWVPLSAIENQNLVSPSSDARLSCWYQGPCLLAAIDSFETPSRDVSKPLVLPICDVIKSAMGQVAACGKIESGAVRNGSKVLVLPVGELATIRAIERDSEACSVARAGDNIAVSLQGVELGHVIPGGVLCHPDFPLPVATGLELKILVLDIVTPILIGLQVECHVHHAKEAARVVKICALLDQKTGKVSKTTPRILKAKQSAIIEVELGSPVCVAEFAKCKALGRVFLRSSGNTIAVGIITGVFERRSWGTSEYHKS